MALETFSWYPRVSAAGTVTYRVRKSQMGDGYTQTAADGINPRTQTWDLMFVGDDAYIRPIKEFLDRHAGIKSFMWSPPIEPLGLYKCDSFKPLAMGGDNYSLSATFTEYPGV